MLTYPGIHALAWYRVAHYFETHRLPLLAALLSQHAARRTGILIHPAAQIGHRSSLTMVLVLSLVQRRSLKTTLQFYTASL